MHNIDIIIAELITVMQDLNCEFGVNVKTDTSAQLKVKRNESIYDIWYDDEETLYSFSLQNGGSKECHSIDEFKELFTTYLYICEDCIPHAKTIVDSFEYYIDSNTVYDNFISDKNSDKVIIVFKVLGKPNLCIHVITSNGSNVYTVELKEMADDTTKLKTLKTYLYKIDETNNAVLLPNICMYMDKLYSRYETSEDVYIKRTDLSSFSFTMDNRTMNVDVIFDDSIKYVVKSCDGHEFDNPINLSIENSVDIKCLFDTFDEVFSLIEDNEPVHDTDNTVAGDLPTVDFNDDSLDTEENTGVVAEELVEPIEKAQENIEPDLEEITPTVEEADLDEEDIDLNADLLDIDEVTVIYEEGVASYIRFYTKNYIYDMNLDVTSSLGLPISRIVNKEDKVKVKGILITPGEIRLHKFAIDISEDIELCNDLFFSLFN